MTHTISIVEPARPERVQRHTHTLNLIDYWFLTRTSIKKEKEKEKLKVMECVYTYIQYIFLIFCVLYIWKFAGKKQEIQFSRLCVIYIDRSI